MALVGAAPIVIATIAARRLNLHIDGSPFNGEQNQCVWNFAHVGSPPKDFGGSA